MKIIAILSCLFSSLSFNAAESVELQQITYGWLRKNDPDQGEHLPYLREIFVDCKDKTMLQFGISCLTKYFLDNCKKVISLEFITHGFGPSAITDWLAFYKSCSNLIPIAYLTGYQGGTDWAFFKYFGSDSIYRATVYQAEHNQSYLQVDPKYLEEFEFFLDNLTKRNKFEFAFVSPLGTVTRGDLVQVLFGKVPIIMIGSASSRIEKRPDSYGYREIITPDDYVEIQLPKNTVVWVSKAPQYSDLIDRLQNM